MVGYGAKVRHPASNPEPVLSINADGSSPFVLVCDHASNRIPERYGDLGLNLVQRLMHIAWDPGALAVALELSQLLDAPLIHSTVSRLVIDCNRAIDAVDLIPRISERTEIPGNLEVSDEDRAFRIAAYHAPFHAAIDRLLDARLEAGRETILVTVHSFTPVYKDVPRPWPIGLIHGTDPTFTAALRDALAEDDRSLNIGWNQPYSALQGVTYTLEHHGDRRNLPATMIEIRHDEILEPQGVSAWAQRLARCLEAARTRVSAAIPASISAETAQRA
ncbi:MAG TPA: N-formylglutamate amidohydrolase [Alphaproteobacteria bacterium]|nr:N-formylglutamate amidohydrolase [Alphaproteobacteria bacterium]